MEPTQQADFINIEEVIRKKNANLLKVMPGFVIRYLKRILHQDLINNFIRRHGHKSGFDFIDAIIDEFGPVITYTGLENIPDHGGAVIASNHPLGGLDAMALLNVIGKKRRDQKFIVNDVLLTLKNFSEIFIGVNKHGKNTSDILEKIDSLYAGDSLMLIFPAGLVSRKQAHGVIKDLEWKKSFIVKAKKYNRDIIPVHIGGNNSNFFYNLARFRQRIGIGANIEMFYLMDEMVKQMGKAVPITIGKPIPPSAFTSEFTDKEWAQKVKEHVYELGKGNISHQFGSQISV